MQKKIHIALADDHELLREGLASLLKEVEYIDIVASVSSGEEAVNVANDNNLDLILMDIVMKGMSGIEATRWIKEQNPKTKIILISSEVNKDFITEGVKVGIDGYLPKDTNKGMLLEAINAIMRGEKFFSAEITALIFEDFYLKETDGKGVTSKKTRELSKREEEVLALIAAGFSIKKIADKLFISAKTVETHKIHIQDKLGLENVAQLVKYAIDHKII